jgi:hypothetical protein
MALRDFQFYLEGQTVKASVSIVQAILYNTAGNHKMLRSPEEGQQCEFRGIMAGFQEEIFAMPTFKSKVRVS